MKSLKTSLLQRSPKLLSATAKILVGKDLDSVLDNISELKGVPQKLGQLMSMDVTQYIPEDLKEKLKPLQGESKEMDSETMLHLLKRQIGEEKFEQVHSFGLKALGAGSIGQVHKASLNSRDVVFKIQYPEIARTIETDMALLTPISKVYEFIRPKSKDFSILLKETRTMLLNELNYEKEKENLLYFREKVARDDRYYVPEVFPEYSTDKVLCMEYVEGMTLNDYIKSKASSEEKKKIAGALLDLFIDEFLLWGKVQTDPNFANYLVTADGTLVLLDFGAVKSFSPSFRKLYLALLFSAYEGDDEKILHYGEELGLVHRSDKKEAVALFGEFMREVLSYFHHEKNPVDFKNEAITGKLLVTGWKLFKEQRISSPHSDLVFLHRKLGGLFSLLKEMGLEIDLHEHWKKMGGP